MARTPHPDKDIEKALRVAEESGWRVERSGSHAWGKIYCPYNNADCRCGEFCITRVWSTPRKPGNHARAAMLSALADVQRALPEAKLIEAAPDLVGLTDIANLIGVTRQNMRKLMLGHGASFPAPLHEGSASVWHLADILEWLKEKGSYTLDDKLAELADNARQINLAKEARQLMPELRSEIEALLA